MGKKIVLIVEDDHDLRELIVEKLNELGYQVSQAADGDEGIALVQKVRPDVIVSDVIMPKKDGNKFLKELRQTDFGKKIPFIVLTARVAMRDYFEVMDVDAFVEKPFKMDDLVKRIEEAIHKHTIQEELGRAADDKDRPSKQGPTSKDEILIIQEAVKIRTVSGSASEEKGAEGLASGEKREVPRTKYHQHRKILILENNMDAFYELQRIFYEMGNSVQLAATPQECIEEANSIGPDLIILRNVFNKIDAEELANHLKAIPRLRKTPIIIYNNIGQKGEAVNAEKLKAAAFVLNREGKEVIKKAVEILEA